jgi:hypothetical protein
MTTPPQATQAQAAAAPQSVNGTAPAAGQAAEDCPDCASSGERALAITGMVIGLGIFVMGLDVALGYRLSRAVGLGKGGGGDVSADAGS